MINNPTVTFFFTVPEKAFKYLSKMVKLYTLAMPDSILIPLPLVLFFEPILQFYCIFLIKFFAIVLWSVLVIIERP